jgi:hypothetical protein
VGTTLNNGCPEEGSGFTAANKKLFIKNFQTVLLHIPTKFAKIKKGEADIDASEHISWYKSTVLLFPNYSDKDANRIMFGTYSGKPVVAFTESIRLDVKTLVEILMPVLKAKSMIEVNSLYSTTPEEGRSFRSKEAVLQITYNATQQISQILIGKLPAYYEAGIKPIAGKPTVKPSAPLQKTTIFVDNKPKRSTNTFIDKIIFEDILKAVCENTILSKLKNNVIPKNNQWYETSFATSKPLYYYQVSEKQFDVKTSISASVNNLEAAVAYINSHMQQTVACQEAYRALKLTKDEGKQSYSDVYAWDGGGLFMVVQAYNGEIQLLINKITYSNEEKKKIVTPDAPKSICTDFEQILTECVSGYRLSKGGFVKNETPATYYTTTLPGLGFDKKFVVESKNINIENGTIAKAKNVIYFSAEQDFTNKDDAIKMYEKVKTSIQKCFSGNANSTDDRNQKIFETFIIYKGYNIRIALVYLNFFNSSVSISIKLAEE